MAPLDFLYPILPSSDRHRQTLLYGPPPGHPSSLPIPENRRTGLGFEQREIIERNFAYQTTTSPSRSWSLEKTEQYVHYKDLKTIAYLYDYPACEWVNCAEVARFAVEALLAREAMRALGVSVFAEDTPFSWWMNGQIDPEIKEEVEPKVEVKHEPLASPSDPPAKETFTMMEEPKVQTFGEHQAEEGVAIEKGPMVTHPSRRSTRISQRKLEEEFDQQVEVKKEPEEESAEPKPHTPKSKEISTALEGSKGKKIVQIKQEDEEFSPRCSTRNAPKRKFADEPWSTPTKNSKP